MSATKVLSRFAVISVVVAILASIVMAYSSGIHKTFGPPKEPVRYTWMQKNKFHTQERKCEVRYPDKRIAPCEEFKQAELNEFRLEYTNPYRNKM